MYYTSSLWVTSFAAKGYKALHPEFSGYGGQVVSLYPDRIIGVHLSASKVDDAADTDVATLAAIADQ